MLSQPAFAPEVVAGALCSVILAAGVAAIALRGARATATAWWLVMLVAAGMQPLAVDLARHVDWARSDGGAVLYGILQLAKVLTAAIGAYLWFGRTLVIILMTGAVGLSFLSLTLAPAAFHSMALAAGAAILLGIAGWLFGRRREGAMRLPLVLGFGLLGALDFLAVADPANPLQAWWPGVLTPAATTSIAIGLALLAFGRQQQALSAAWLGRTLQAALDQASVGIALYDHEDRLRFANRHFLSFYGRGDGATVMGRRFEDILRESVSAKRHTIKGDTVEQFLAERLDRHRNPRGPFMQALSDGRAVQIREHRLPDGSTVGTWNDVTDLKRHDDALALALGGRTEGGDFMTIAVRALALGLGYRWTHIGRLSTEGDRIDSVVAWDTDRVVENFSYAIAGTPCGDAVIGGYCFVADDVVTRYPTDKVLAKYGARSYCGMLLRDRSGRIIGHVAALNDRPDSPVAEHRGFLSVMSDWISNEFDRRSAEAALRASEQRVRDFAEAASEWFYEMDADLRFTYVSPRMLDATGIDPVRLIGLHRLDVVGECSEASLAEHMSDLANHRPFRGFQYLSKPQFGAPRYLSISGKPIFDPDGRFLGYRGTGRDVTRERQALTDATRKSALLDTAVAHMAEGILIVDQTGHMILANERARAMLDVPAALLTPGQHSHAIMRYLAKRGDYGPHDGSDVAIDRLVTSRDANMMGQDTHAFERPTPDGRMLEARGRRTPAGELVITYIDITHLKHAETAILRAKEAAEFANRSKTEFLATVSHELRTPLNAIIGFSEIIRDQAFGAAASDRYRGYAGDIHDSGVHLLNIINDILDLAKVEAGAVELHIERVDIHDGIEQAVRLVRQRAEATGLELIFDLPQSLPQIEADPRRLVQIFLNLVSNAVKFTPRGGHITVSAQPDGSEMVIEFADTGIGMTEAEIKIALEPFRQVESALSRSFEGTGLGLPLAKSLIELHRGSLTIDSIPGQGTRAIVRLPLRHQARSERA